MAIAFMIHHALRPESLFNAFFEFVHPKIYVVCLLGESACSRGLLSPLLGDEMDRGLRPRIAARVHSAEE